MFYGNDWFKPVQGQQVGLDIVSGKLTLPGGVTQLRAGTFLAYKASLTDEFSPADNGKGVIGWLTQKMDAVGLTMENFAIVHNPNYALKSGSEVSVRVPAPGQGFEVEGAGAAAGGNLVVTMVPVPSAPALLATRH